MGSTADQATHGPPLTVLTRKISLTVPGKVKLAGASFHLLGKPTFTEAMAFINNSLVSAATFLSP